MASYSSGFRDIDMLPSTNEPNQMLDARNALAHLIDDLQHGTTYTSEDLLKRLVPLLDPMTQTCHVINGLQARKLMIVPEPPTFLSSAALRVKRSRIEIEID